MTSREEEVEAGGEGEDFSGGGGRRNQISGLKHYWSVGEGGDWGLVISVG